MLFSHAVHPRDYTESLNIIGLTLKEVKTLRNGNQTFISIPLTFFFFDFFTWKNKQKNLSKREMWKMINGPIQLNEKLVRDMLHFPG